MSYFEEFDKFGRYIESPCYGYNLDDCEHCPRNKNEENYG